MTLFHAIEEFPVRPYGFLNINPSAALTLSNDSSNDSSAWLLFDVKVPLGVMNLLFKFTWVEKFRGMVVEFIPKEIPSSMAQSGMRDCEVMFPPPSAEEISFLGCTCIRNVRQG